MDLFAQDDPSFYNRDFLEHRYNQRVSFLTNRGRLADSAIHGYTLDNRLFMAQRRLYGLRSCVDCLADLGAPLDRAFTHRSDFLMERDGFHLLGTTTWHFLLDPRPQILDSMLANVDMSQFVPAKAHDKEGAGPQAVSR